MSEQNKAIVRRLIEDHWNKRNAAIVGELYSPTVSLRTPDGLLTGLEGASFLLQAYAAAFPDFRIDIDDIVAEGDKVVVRWTFTGTHRGPLANVPPTGRIVTVPTGIGIYRLEGGKVCEGDFAWNKFLLLEQLGAVAVVGSPSSAGV